MRTGQRKLNGSASTSTLHSAHKPLRRRQRAARLALIASIPVASLFWGLSLSDATAQEKEPPRLFRGGLVQQLRSMTEKPETDSAPTDTTDSAPASRPRTAICLHCPSRDLLTIGLARTLRRNLAPRNCNHKKATRSALPIPKTHPWSLHRSGGPSNPTNRTAAIPKPNATLSRNPSKPSGSGAADSISNKLLVSLRRARGRLRWVFR